MNHGLKSLGVVSLLLSACATTTTNTTGGTSEGSEKITATGSDSPTPFPGGEGENAVATLAPGVRQKEFKVGKDLRVGDCLMRGNYNGDEARVVVNSDGTARFRAYVRSEDSGDAFTLVMWGATQSGDTTLFPTKVLKTNTLPKSKDTLWFPVFTWGDGTGSRFDELHSVTFQASSCQG